MSMGTKLPSGMFNTGYTQPYGSGSAANMYGGGFGGGTYDPMLGFGQASGMGTTYDYPTRYSADYTRYAQSGMPFNQPVMGYNSYGQIFAQPQRPPPTMGKGGSGFRPQPPSFGGKGGGGFRPQPPAMGGKGRVGSPGVRNPGRDRLGMPLITDLPQQPPTIGGKGGPQPENDGVTISYPGGSRTVPRFPQRRSNQLGLTGGPGVTPPPLTGGVPTDSIGGFGPGVTDPREQMNYALGRSDNNVPEPLPVQADRQIIDENIYNSPFSQLIGGGLGGMPKQTVDPYQGSYQISEIPYQQQQLLAQQQQISDRAPPGFMRNPNYNAARGMQEDLPRGQEDYLSRQAFIPAGGGFGRLAFQEGGQVPLDAASNVEMMMAETEQPEMAGEYDRLIQMTMQAILGQVESPDEVIQMFIDEFGVDAFRQLRDAVLKQQVPGAQTEGMVDGNGGGMDDQVMGMIGNQRPVAVSPGEYIVPADVVSGLGDGSSQAGADILDELNQAVRMTRTGTTQQPRPLMETLQQ